MKPGLGTQLRHLIDLLDGAVGDAYDAAGLDYRPRYTPVMRALASGKALSISQIAQQAHITQPAATQTVSLMLKADLLQTEASSLDARQKMVRLSPHGKAILPKLKRCWAATKAAADSLDADMSHPLSDALAEAIAALEQRPFGERIKDATHNKEST